LIAIVPIIRIVVFEAALKQEVGEPVEQILETE
jgi:hypothetical protein